jgi:hypothetical protein
MCNLITTLTLLLAGVFYQGTNPLDHSEKAGNPSEKSEKKEKQLVTVADSTHAAVCEPQGNPKENSTNNSDNNVAHWFNYLNAAATTVSAFFAFLVWLVYRAILRATKINERAWIVPVVGSIEPTANPEEFQVKVELTNNGKTPAWITAAGSSGKGATEQQPLPTMPPYTEMKPFSKKGSLLSPTGSLAQGFPLTRERLDHVQAGKSQLFIFGYARYRDVYGDPHIVRYCFEAQKTQDANHPHPLEFYVSGPDEYMDAD